MFLGESGNLSRSIDTCKRTETERLTDRQKTDDLLMHASSVSGVKMIPLPNLEGAYYFSRYPLARACA